MLRITLLILFSQQAIFQWILLYEGLFGASFGNSDLSNWSHKVECAMDKTSCGSSSSQTITCNQNPNRLVAIRSNCRFTHLNLTTNIPHWQMKVIFDSYFISKLDKELEIYLGDYFSKELINSGNTPFNKDNCLSIANDGFGFNTSVIVANHANSSVGFALCTQSDSNPTGVLVGFRNVQVLINQCHYSCKNCTGPNSNNCNACYTGGPNLGSCTACSQNTRFLRIGYTGSCVEECQRDELADPQNVCRQSQTISTLSSDFSDNFYSSFGSWTIIPSPGDVNTDARYFTCANKYIGLFMKNEGVQKSFSLGLTIRYIRLRAQLLLVDWANLVRIAIIVNNKVICYIAQTDGNIAGTGCTVYYVSPITCPASYKQIKVELFTYASQSSTTVKFIGYMKQSIINPASKWGLRSVLVDQQPCASDCALCASSMTCQTCQTSFFLHQGKCVANCPAHSILQGQNCQDFVEATPYSEYLIKAFYDTSQSESDADITSIIGSCIDFTGHQNRRSGKFFGHLKSKRVFGGPFSLHKASCTKTFSQLLPHYGITVKMQLIMGEGAGSFIYQLDDEVLASLTQTDTPYSSENIAGKATHEKIFFIDRFIQHSLNQLQVIAIYQATASSVESGWGAIADYFLIIHKCVPFCQACTDQLASSCTNWASNIGGNLNSVNPLQCQPQRYFDFNSSTCLFCSDLCSACSSADSCSTCVLNAFLSDHECFCNDNYYKSDRSTCASCHSSCSTCSGPTSQDCLSCSSANGRVLDITTCTCPSPLVDDGSGNCVGVCGNSILEPGEECDDGNTVPYDGCYQCFFQCIEHCASCTNGNCSDCSSGYNLNQSNTLCIQVKCIPNCQTCEQSGTCIQCKKGFYLNYQSSQCEPACGDQIVAGDEQCDDGNLLPFDGCFGCQFSCDTSCTTCVFGQCLQCFSEQPLDAPGSCVSKLFQCEAGCTLCNFETCLECNSEKWTLGIIQGRCSPIQQIEFDHSTYDCSVHCDLCVNGECTLCLLGFQLSYGQCIELIGDGLIVGFEECDDNNSIPFDGCYMAKFQCQWECLICDYGRCQQCMNGYYVNELQKCYQSNASLPNYDNQGFQCCSERCELCVNGSCLSCHQGWILNEVKGACDNDCGNGLIESSEECDDGNLILGDGCDFCKASCAAGCLNCEYGRCIQCVEGYSLTTKHQCRLDCGNFEVSAKECDDENNNPYDGCDKCKLSCQETCQHCVAGMCLLCDRSAGYYLDEVDGLCKSKCGDFVVAGGEICEINFGGSQKCFQCNFYCVKDCQICELGVCMSCDEGFELSFNGFCIPNSDLLVYGQQKVEEIENLYCELNVYGLCYKCREHHGYQLNEITRQCQPYCWGLSSIFGTSCTAYEVVQNCSLKEGLQCRDCAEGFTLDKYSNSCRANCGNGIVQIGEECDDGNQNQFDGCHQCAFECQEECLHCASGICLHCDDQGWVLNKVEGSCTTICGDLVVAGREQCDDGNFNNEDECTNDCQLACQSVCTLCQDSRCLECNTIGWKLQGDRCAEVCGDGLLVGSEHCEDLNLIRHDGCHNCYFECHESCIICHQGKCLQCDEGLELQNYTCSPICGDMLIRDHEECDDGNNFPFDGCFECKFSCIKHCSMCEEDKCLLCLSGWELDNSGQCSPICGDGIVQVGLENCDDANNFEFDGCHDCKYSCGQLCAHCEKGLCLACSQDGWYPHQHTCKTKCGDGIVAGNEICDDLNYFPYDGCYACQFQCHQFCQTCIDGVCLECELGWEERGSQCESQCGDGKWVPQEEECDDWNLDNFDGCSTLCEIESGYFCYNKAYSVTTCIMLDQPEFILKIVDQTYRQAIVELTFTEEMKIVPGHGFSKEGFLFKLLAVDDKDYYCTIEELVPPSLEKPTFPKYHFIIHFLNEVQRPYFYVATDSSALVSQNDTPLRYSSAQIRLQSAHIISDTEVQVAISAQKFSTGMIITMLGLSTISVALGSFALVQNILDQIQFLSYIKYINFDFPENLQLYFECFNLVTLNPILQFLNFDSFMQSLTGSHYTYIEPGRKFKADDINASFLPNIESFLFCLLCGYLIFTATYILNQMINLIQPYHIIMRPLFIMHLYLRIRSLLLSYWSSFHYSGLLRIIMGSFNEICFAFFLSLYYQDTGTTKKSLNFYFSIITLQAILVTTFLLITYTRSLAFRSNLKSTNVEAFYDGVDQSKQFWGLQFNSILFIKKFLLMFFIVCLQQNPNAQSICISMNSTVFLVYLSKWSPLTDKSETVRLFITELQISINTLFFLLYSRDRGLQVKQSTQVIIGWINIALFSFSLLVSLLLDIISKVKIMINYLKKYACEEIDSKIVLY